MNDPWFSPVQLATSLGITLPLFGYYGYRIYSEIFDHIKGLSNFSKMAFIQQLVRKNNLKEQSGATNIDLSIASIGSEFDLQIGCRRRALKVEAHSAILVGFLGTLVGVSGAFASLIVKSSSVDPMMMMEGLIKGGLATALISSLVAAVLGVIVYSYLSITEEKVSIARHNLLQGIRRELSPENKGENNELDT